MYLADIMLLAFLQLFDQAILPYYYSVLSNGVNLEKSGRRIMLCEQNGENDMSREELTFTVFLIHQLAEAWGQSPSQVYERLVKAHILDEYVIRHYDVLHTLGRDYLIDDITSFLKERAG
jgi:hypothetical protein